MGSGEETQSRRAANVSDYVVRDMGECFGLGLIQICPKTKSCLTITAADIICRDFLDLLVSSPSAFTQGATYSGVLQRTERNRS
jgi:hypothetical protein